jgi:hypothetical protein
MEIKQASRAFWEDIGISSEEFLRVCLHKEGVPGVNVRYRSKGNKRYVKITWGKYVGKKFDYNDIRKIVEHIFPDAKMTSAGYGSFGARLNPDKLVNTNTTEK